MSFVILLGRFFYSAIFIMSALGHFSPEAKMYAEAQGVPYASFLVPFSGIIALVGGLSILLGFKAKIGGWLLVIFLVPVTIMMHRFWVVSDPLIMSYQQAVFAKNVSMLGAALIIAYFGSGPFSLKR